MKRENKIIAFYSPVPQSGQTTQANLIGLELAKRGKYVLVLEMSRTTGFSIYLNKNLGEFKRDLKGCLVNPATFKENLMKSAHSNRLFYICQNYFSSLTDLTSYNPTNLDLIIGQAKELFDYVFIDLPSSTDDVATVQVLGRNFTHKIDHYVVNITENVMAMKRLNDFDALLAKSTIDNRKQDTTIMVNKSYGRYTPYIEPALKNLPKSNIVNLVDILNVNELPYVSNEGDLLRLGQNSEAKEFFKQVSQMADILDKELRGVGMQKVKETTTSKKLRGAKIEVDGEDTKKKGKDKKAIKIESSTDARKTGKNKKGRKNNKTKNDLIKEGVVDTNTEGLITLQETSEEVFLEEVIDNTNVLSYQDEVGVNEETRQTKKRDNRTKTNERPNKGNKSVKSKNKNTKKETTAKNKSKGFLGFLKKKPTKEIEEEIEE